MRISKREQILVIVLAVVAVVVLFMHSQDNSAKLAEESGNAESAARVLAQFRQVHALPDFAGSSDTSGQASERNIFRYGQQGPDAQQPEEADAETPEVKEIQTARETAALEAAEQTGVLSPPAIDFTVLGIIETTSGKAAVISKTPELFVVREASRFLEKFILKEVTRDGITIGYIGFEETTFLPLETGRGF